MKATDYQITVHWSESDKAFEAEIPALKNCIAFGDSPQEAMNEVLIAAELWLEAAPECGIEIPKPDIGLDKLSVLFEIVNMTALARLSGISPQTLASKMKRRTPLSERENKALEATLLAYGITARIPTHADALRRRGVGNGVGLERGRS